MSAWFTLVRRLLGDSKWMLGLSAAALFGMSWLSVYVTGRFEARMRSASDPVAAVRRAGFLRGMGGAAMDFSSAAIEVTWWNHPFFLMTIAVWAIGRGSLTVAGEIERGGLDLTLSRPISRTSYLSGHVAVAVGGLACMMAGILVGNLVGTHYNRIEVPPGLQVLARPALNLLLLGVAIFGYTLLLSAVDVVRWRPILYGSVLTLAGFVAYVVANVPSMEDYKWLEKFSIFKAYNPVEAAVKAENLGFNCGILAAVGGLGVLLAWAVFTWRDLPANS
jgi:ABC-2 type transport system permease protein